MPRSQGQLRLSHVLFGVALLTLFVLGGRWFALVYQQVRTIHSEFSANRQAEAELRALRLGLQLKPPVVGRDGPFEVLPGKNLAPGEKSFSCQPNWPSLTLRVSPQAQAEEASRLERRMVMVVGEGSLMVLLILVCVFMLYRLLLTERRSRLQMETFFRAVGHELKTPVAGLRALLETLAERPLPKEDLERFAKLGLRETARLQALIENVLLANRIRRHLFEASPKAVKFVAEVRRLIESRNRLFDKQPVALLVETPEDVRAVLDPELLRVVLDNLLDNAFKYSPERPEVRVRLLSDAQWCTIAVSDKGLGFSEEEGRALFEKFYRADRVQNIKGSGLGLFITREIVDAQGGRIAAQSPGPQAGATFTVMFKRA